MPISPCCGWMTTRIRRRLRGASPFALMWSTRRRHIASIPRLRPNDPRYSAQWNLPAIDIERAWDINPGASSSIVVAVLDTGVAYRGGTFRYNARAFRLNNVPFPALGSLDITFAMAPDLGPSDRFVSPRDFIWEDQLPFDLDGHGTHVAGTIGEATDNGQAVAGIAYHVRIMPVKVIHNEWDFIFSAPNEGTDETVARGLRYAADNGAKVINMSLGRTGGPAPAVEEAMRYAVSRGAFVVVSGGNSFNDGNAVEVISQIASRVSGAVSVAAVGRDLERASYSTHRRLHRTGGSRRQLLAGWHAGRRSAADARQRLRPDVRTGPLTLSRAAIRRVWRVLLPRHVHVGAARVGPCRPTL